MECHCGLLCCSVIRVGGSVIEGWGLMNQTGSPLLPLKTSGVTVHLVVLRKHMNLGQHDKSCSPTGMNT